MLYALVGLIAFAVGVVACGLIIAYRFMRDLRNYL